VTTVPTHTITPTETIAPTETIVPALTIAPTRPMVVAAPAVPAPSTEATEAARSRLSPLLVEAGSLDLDDAPGWARLRDAAARTTGVLVDAAVLPPAIRVGDDDVPVVVARTIAAAWRWAAA
jgi:hypothetical protein